MGNNRGMGDIKLNWRNFLKSPYFLDYKTHPPNWEENGGASYSPNVVYLAHQWGAGGGSGELFFFFYYFPPLKPRYVSWSGASYSPQNMVYFIDDAIIVVLIFPPLPPPPSTPDSLRKSPPPLFMSIGHVYKLFGYSISYTVLTSPWLFCNYLFVLLNPLTSSPIPLHPFPSGNHRNALCIHGSVSESWINT